MKEEPTLNDNLQPQPEAKNDKNEMTLSNSAHPFACIFTFLFKAAAFFVYFILGNFFTDVNTFIIVVILSALDFWTVKNVTGRLLVGLRWWSDFDEKGKEVWKFESYDKEFKSSAVDASFFWMSQIAATGTWVAFLLIKILSFSVFWALLCLINLSLVSTNLLGYYKCRGQHNKKIGELQKRLAAQATKTWISNLMK